MKMVQDFINEDTGETFDYRVFDVEWHQGMFYRLMKSFGRPLCTVYRQNGNVFIQSGWKFAKKVPDGQGGKFTQITIVHTVPDKHEVAYQGLKVIL